MTYNALNQVTGADITTPSGATSVEYVYDHEPTLVVGLVDSEVGYSYFQSQLLYQWYQKYSHRWLTLEEPSEP